MPYSKFFLVLFLVAVLLPVVMAAMSVAMYAVLLVAAVAGVKHMLYVRKLSKLNQKETSYVDSK
mgnify:CR=1 FL=1